jgi:uroporphyrinogen-III synthase
MPLIVISNRIKEAAEQIGFVQIAVSASPSDTEIINTVTAFINGD